MYKFIFLSLSHSKYTFLYPDVQIYTIGRDCGLIGKCYQLSLLSPSRNINFMLKGLWQQNIKINKKGYLPFSGNLKPECIDENVNFR